MGTSGNETFDGTGLSDDYIFKAGMGNDRIQETSNNYNEVDRIVFAEGIVLEDVYSFRRDANSDQVDDLVIALHDGGGSMTVLSNFSTAGNAAKFKIGQFVFSDGTVLSEAGFWNQTNNQTVGDFTII
jgi:Ca2+-binding RTX toxin-like protein